MSPGGSENKASLDEQKDAIIALLLEQSPAEVRGLAAHAHAHAHASERACTHAPIWLSCPPASSAMPADDDDSPFDGGGTEGHLRGHEGSHRGVPEAFSGGVALGRRQIHLQIQFISQLPKKHAVALPAGFGAQGGLAQFALVLGAAMQLHVWRLGAGTTC